MHAIKKLIEHDFLVDTCLTRASRGRWPPGSAAACRGTLPRGVRLNPGRPFPVGDERKGGSPVMIGHRACGFQRYYHKVANIINQ